VHAAADGRQHRVDLRIGQDVAHAPLPGARGRPWIHANEDCHARRGASRQS
jgi:hypothetical protein